MDMESCMEHADYFYQEANHVLPNLQDFKKAMPFERKIQTAFLNALKDPQWKNLHSTSGILKQVFEKEPYRSRLVISLLPPEDGYLVTLVNKDGDCLETMELSYEEQDILGYVDDELIPPMLSNMLDHTCKDIFIAGCVPVEVRDYRISVDPTYYKTSYVLLKPSSLTMLEDVNMIAENTSDAYKWTADDKLALESSLTLATSEPLCLDPSPAAMIIKNKMQNNNLFQNHCFKRRIASCGALAIKRRKVLGSRKMPRHLHLHDFLKKRKAKEKKTADLRLPKDVIDIWRKTDLEISPPNNLDDVEKLAKPIQWPENLSDKDILEVQTIHLESEGDKRDVYSRITIGQRPGDMKYFGTLHSNKYFKQSVDDSKMLIPHCVFTLGTEHRANLYILQYQELFTEDGRKPAKVSVVKSGQSGDKTFFIPNQQQPWELIQDKSMYSVSSVVDIPVGLWNNLKMKRTQNKLELNSTLHHRPATSNVNNTHNAIIPQNQKQINLPATSTINLSAQNGQHFVLANNPNANLMQKLIRKKSGNADGTDKVNPNTQTIRLKAGQNIGQNISVQDLQKVLAVQQEHIEIDQNPKQHQQQPQMNFKTIMAFNPNQQTGIVSANTSNNQQQTKTVLRMPFQAQARAPNGQITAINIISTSTGQSIIGPNGAVLGNIQLAGGGSVTIPASHLSASGITMQLNSASKNTGVPQQITLIPTNSNTNTNGQPQHITLVNQVQRPSNQNINLQNWQIQNQGNNNPTQNIRAQILHRTNSQDTSKPRPRKRKSHNESSNE